MKLLFYSFLILTLFFAACNGEKTAEKMAEDAIEKQTGEDADVNIEDGNAEVKTEDGKTEFSTGGSADIPDDFPEDIFICNDAKIQSSAAAQGNFALEYISQNSADDLLDKYMSEMKANDWKVKGEENRTDERLRAFSKDGRSTGITISEEDNHTKVSILTGKD